MSSQVSIRKPVATDWQELLSLHQTSQSLHFPWVAPPLTESQCKTYIDRCHNDDFEGLVICQHIFNPNSFQEECQIVGVVNFSQIFYRSFKMLILATMFMQTLQVKD